MRLISVLTLSLLLLLLAAPAGFAAPTSGSPVDSEGDEAPAIPEGWVADQDGCLFWNPSPYDAVELTESVQWDGECVDGKGSGTGKLVWLLDGEPTGGTFTGTFAGGKLEGEGTIVWPSGARYEGGFHEGLKHGHGVDVFSSGRRFEGEFERGEKAGDMTYTAAPTQSRFFTEEGLDIEALAPVLGVGYLVFALFLYVYFSVTLMVIARKLGHSNPWYAWVPILQGILMCHLGGRSGWWLLGFMIPIVGIVLMILVWIGIASNREKPIWIGAIAPFFPLSLFAWGYLAFGE